MTAQGLRAAAGNSLEHQAARIAALLAATEQPSA
jgi:hypothetical protein